MTLKSRSKWISNSVNRDILSSLLSSRGLTNDEQIKKFLNPQIKDIYDFKNLYGSELAAKRIVKAIKSEEKIFIHGDFDADGVSATAILWDFLYNEVSKKLGTKIDVKPYIPSRVDEGYGLSETSISAMKSEGANLVITVDCGIRDGELIKKHTDTDFEIIVTDHHQIPDDISEYNHIVVHQMYPGNEYPYLKVTGSAIAFLLTQAIRKELGLDFELTKDTPGLDLVALSTVTDMMPILDVNRVFVKYGILQMRDSPRLGLEKLLNLAQVPIDMIDTYHLGYIVGPRINASGRIGNAMDSLRLILAPNEKVALEYSSKLHNLNILRQENTQNILSYISENIDQYDKDKLIFVVGENWHEGVIGLVAGKIFEKTGKPTVVVTKVRDEIKGSARSIKSFNITNALDKFSKYLKKYGGHSQAAGFTIINVDSLDKLKKNLTEYANSEIKDKDLEKEINVDLELQINDINEETFEILEQLKPYGYENPRPIILIKNVIVKDKQIMSQGKHMKLEIEDTGGTIKAVMFNCDEDIDQIDIGSKISLIGNIVLSEWNGKRTFEVQVKEWSENQKGVIRED